MGVGAHRAGLGGSDSDERVSGGFGVKDESLSSDASRLQYGSSYPAVAFHELEAKHKPAFQGVGSRNRGCCEGASIKLPLIMWNGVLLLYS